VTVFEDRMREVMCTGCNADCDRELDDIVACVEKMLDECRELIANISIAQYAS